jgi:endogenous inhibitor of DNA gyrase (YacG/DUF329 family)
MTINEWMTVNDLFQCAGCKGYDKNEYAMWHRSNHYGTLMPYCTEQCKEVDA